MSAEFFSYIALALVILISLCCAVLGFLLLKSRKTSPPESDTDITNDENSEALEEELESLENGQNIEEETKALGDIRKNLEAKVKQVSQLKDIVKEQITSLLGAKKQASKSEGKGLDEEQVDQLIDQTEKSSEIITILKSEFEENIQKLAKQEEQLAKKNLDMAKVRKLFKQHQKLKSMYKKLAGETSKLKKEIQQKSNTIDELKNQQATPSAANTSANASGLTTSEHPDELEKSLARAIREKEFIESHYLELVEKLPDAEKLKQELENTKKELSMLEEQVTGKE